MSAAVLDREQVQAVARLFSVLAEPTRLAILQELKDRPRPVGELVERLGAKQANVSKQLGVLFDAGLVGRERRGNLVVYSVREPMIFELCGLVCGKLRRDAQRLARLFR
jgi:DNA-binding transcriptional ArsR family regulator